MQLYNILCVATVVRVVVTQHAGESVGGYLSCDHLIMMLTRSGHGGWNSRGRGASHSGAGGSLLLQHGPVEGVVVLVVEGAEEDPEHGPH